MKPCPAARHCEDCGLSRKGGGLCRGRQVNLGEGDADSAAELVVGEAGGSGGAPAASPASESVSLSESSDEPSASSSS